MPLPSRRIARVLAPHSWPGWALGLALLCAGCSTVQAVVPVATAAAASAPAGAASSAAPHAGDETPAKPFADVVKGAQRQEGFLPVWRKDEKVWLEVAPERLGKPILFSINIAQSVGERGLYASQMGPHWLVRLRIVGKQLQLVAPQMEYRGARDPALAAAVGEGFSDSLIAAAPLASAPQPQSKAVLVDASFLLGDLAGYSTALEAAFRLPYSVDKANSYFERARADAAMTTLSLKLHYAVPRLPAPPLLPPGAPRPPLPSPPSTAPDPRSLYIGEVYSLRELPAVPMAARAADARVGFFTDSYSDLSDDVSPNPRVHPIRRWRLEKKDPTAALSEPVRPITYWLDRNIPRHYRAAVTAGILEWNKAFERIGFKNAIVVRQQQEGDDFDTLDAEHASVRWFVGADVGFAIGPSHGDPRSGEILDADIAMSDVFGRGARRAFREDIGPAGAPSATQALGRLWGDARDARCDYGAEAAQEAGFAFELLAARGELDPDSPEADAFAQAYVRSVITHEVGHTLGLRHNFRASTTVTRAQLRDKAFGDAHGISGSVMDYNPFNLALPGEAQGELTMTTLGPYDYWAIEYGYKPVAPAHEAAELKAIAERSRSDPTLAFADDADAYNPGDGLGVDPRVNTFDAGDDPLAYATRRFALTRELWLRTEKRGVQPGDDALRLRRSLLEGLRQAERMPALAAKYIGGMYGERDIQGTGRVGYKPVEPARQRQALRFLADEIFAAESFRFTPEFLASMTPDYTEDQRLGPVSVSDIVLRLQRQVLDKVFDAGTARRLLDLPNFLPAAERRGAISLDEVYRTLQSDIWSELKAAHEIDALRRSLQREYLKRLQQLLTRPSGDMPADAVSLARARALELQRQLRAALARKGWPAVDRAHLDDALALLTEALRATLQRS